MRPERPNPIRFESQPVQKAEAQGVGSLKTDELLSWAAGPRMPRVSKVRRSLARIASEQRPRGPDPPLATLDQGGVAAPDEWPNPVGSQVSGATGLELGPLCVWFITHTLA